MRTRLMQLLIPVVGMIAVPAHAEYVMRISHQLPPGHHIAGLMDRFAENVAAGTDGRVSVRLHGENERHQPHENHTAVRDGEVEAALSVNFQWGDDIPELSIFTVPYFLTDLDSIEGFPRSELAGMLESRLAETGVHQLGWFYTTRQSIFTTNEAPVRTIDDLAGKRIRGLNPLLDEGLIAAGGEPVGMPGSALYDAIVDNRVDIGLTDVSAAYSRRHFEVQEYGTVSPFFSVFFLLYVNPQWWASLDDGLREAIVAAANRAEEAAVGRTEQAAMDAIERLRDVGMVLHVQDGADADAFADVMQAPVIEAFRTVVSDADALLEAAERM